jgi:hypothetical protein
VAEREVEVLKRARENFVRKRREMAEQMIPSGAVTRRLMLHRFSPRLTIAVFTSGIMTVLAPVPIMVIGTPNCVLVVPITLIWWTAPDSWNEPQVWSTRTFATMSGLEFFCWRPTLNGPPSGPGRITPPPTAPAPATTVARVGMPAASSPMIGYRRSCGSSIAIVVDQPPPKVAVQAKRFVAPRSEPVMPAQLSSFE